MKQKNLVEWIGMCDKIDIFLQSIHESRLYFCSFFMLLYITHMIIEMQKQQFNYISLGAYNLKWRSIRQLKYWQKIHKLLVHGIFHVNTTLICILYWIFILVAFINFVFFCVAGFLDNYYRIEKVNWYQLIQSNWSNIIFHICTFWYYMVVMTMRSAWFVCQASTTLLRLTKPLYKLYLDKIGCWEVDNMLCARFQTEQEKIQNVQRKCPFYDCCIQRFCLTKGVAIKWGASLISKTKQKKSKWVPIGIDVSMLFFDSYRKINVNCE